MAVQTIMRFSSYTARHSHVLWSETLPDTAQLTIPERCDSDQIEFPVTMFDKRLAPLRHGRFYPSHIIVPPRELPGDLFRVITVGSRHFLADFNHPLSGKEVVVRQGAAQAGRHAPGRPETLLQWAGIETPYDETETDFTVPSAFHRGDPGDDGLFYAHPRRVLHVDRTCISRITDLYATILKTGGFVLDLMSSWRSHLPDGTEKAVGLGMNAEEMADNPQLSSYIVHDLNRNPSLPFESGGFDAVVNTASIEYITHPHEIVAEVMRILRPGGIFVVAFSVRCFPPKTIFLWTHLHPVERLGWVIQLFRRAGFSSLHSLAEYGLKRSAHDRYADRIQEMDPVFAVWGEKAAG